MSHQASNWASTKIVTESSCKNVLLVMAEAAREDGSEARISQWNLAKRTGLTDRTVRRALEKLEKEWGLIRRGDQSKVAHLPADQRPIVWDLNLSKTGYFGVDEEELEKKRKERNKRSNDRRKANAVDTADTTTAVRQLSNSEDYGHSVRGTADMVSGGLRTQSPGTTDTMSPRTVLEPSIEPSVEPSSLSPRQSPILAPVESPAEDATFLGLFDEAYHAYPQEGGYVTAKRTYDKLIKDRVVDHATIMLGISNYAADPHIQRQLADVEQCRFVPQLNRWLEDRRWKRWVNPQPKLARGDQKFLANIASADNPPAVAHLLASSLSHLIGQPSSDPDPLDTTHPRQLGAA